MPTDCPSSAVQPCPFSKRACRQFKIAEYERKIGVAGNVNVKAGGSAAVPDFTDIQPPPTPAEFEKVRKRCLNRDFERIRVANAANDFSEIEKLVCGKGDLADERRFTIDKLIQEASDDISEGTSPQTRLAALKQLRKILFPKFHARSE